MSSIHAKNFDDMGSNCLMTTYLPLYDESIRSMYCMIVLCIVQVPYEMYLRGTVVPVAQKLDQTTRPNNTSHFCG